MDSHPLRTFGLALLAAGCAAAPPEELGLLVEPGKSDVIQTFAVEIAPGEVQTFRFEVPPPFSVRLEQLDVPEDERVGAELVLREADGVEYRSDRYRFATLPDGSAGVAFPSEPVVSRRAERDGPAGEYEVDIVNHGDRTLRGEFFLEDEVLEFDCPLLGQGRRDPAGPTELVAICDEVLDPALEEHAPRRVAEEAQVCVGRRFVNGEPVLVLGGWVRRVAPTRWDTGTPVEDHLALPFHDGDWVRAGVPFPREGQAVEGDALRQRYVNDGGYGFRRRAEVRFDGDAGELEVVASFRPLWLPLVRETSDAMRLGCRPLGRAALADE